MVDSGQDKGSIRRHAMLDWAYIELNQGREGRGGEKRSSSSLVEERLAMKKRGSPGEARTLSKINKKIRVHVLRNCGNFDQDNFNSVTKMNIF